MNKTDLKKQQLREDAPKLSCTVPDFEKFINSGNQDAITLLLYYQWTAMIQGNRQIYAYRSFCCKGLHWGTDRFDKAKQALINYGYITDLKERDEKGRFVKDGKKFTRLNFFSVPSKYYWKNEIRENNYGIEFEEEGKVLPYA